jgi:hypothetical protein
MRICPNEDHALNRTQDHAIIEKHGSCGKLGYGRTPHRGVKPGERAIAVDEYLGWAAEPAPGITIEIE